MFYMVCTLAPGAQPISELTYQAQLSTPFPGGKIIHCLTGLTLFTLPHQPFVDVLEDFLAQ